MASGLRRFSGAGAGSLARRRRMRFITGFTWNITSNYISFQSTPLVLLVVPVHHPHNIKTLFYFLQKLLILNFYLPMSKFKCLNDNKRQTLANNYSDQNKVALSFYWLVVFVTYLHDDFIKFSCIFIGIQVQAMFSYRI